MRAMKVFGMAVMMGLVVGVSCVGEEAPKEGEKVSEAANVEQLQTFYGQ